MIWTKYSIKTTTKDADMVSAVLMDYGIYDIQIENNVQLTDDELNQMYADFVKELPEDDGTCFIDFYVEFEENEEARLTKMAELEEVKKGLMEACELFNLDPLEFSFDNIDSADWETKWKAYFKPFLVDDILIKPTWEALPEDAEFTTMIEIDPGMAFGTGMHETTRLCLKGIRKYMKEGDRFLDLGTGSGILSIAALKLGACRADALDIDPQAVVVAHENFAVNNIPEHT
ncbi:MAG: 50S ribosomal protein L11 methyltransferase, partial [Parasporobacterium sp.]|nr:50S ribosomal protein L11 methyltransferase [Parasporobacterium sp.]